METASPPDVADSIRAYFRDDPSRMTMMAARKFAVPERAVVDALVGTWPIARLRDGSFRDLMAALPGLGTMRVFVRSRAAVIESVGQFGGYSETGPFFNVQTDTLDMHILHEEVGPIYSVRKVGHDSILRHPLVPVLRPRRATPPSRRSSGKASPTSRPPDRGIRGPDPAVRRGLRSARGHPPSGGASQATGPVVAMAAGAFSAFPARER